MNPLHRLTLVLTLTAVPLTSNAMSQACSRQSPSHTIALLELYTSEGCSSCPPADKFVSNLHKGFNAAQVVPLSLHVDYWDYIGWKDIYGKRDFTERQRWLSELANTRTIYTPEFFVGGKEVRDWNWSLRGGVAGVVKRINAMPARADIGMTVGKPANGSVPLEITAKSAPGGKLYIALYENAIVSEVRSGENRGETLKHDYVVRDWLGPIALPADRTTKAALPRPIAVPAGAVAKNLGVAAFVQNDKGEVLQALALPVCGG